MHVKAGVGETDEPFVEPFLVGAALVPTHEKDRLPAGLNVQINGDTVRMLDQRAVADALRRVKLP